MDYIGYFARVVSSLSFAYALGQTAFRFSTFELDNELEVIVEIFLTFLSVVGAYFARDLDVPWNTVRGGSYRFFFFWSYHF